MVMATSSVVIRVDGDAQVEPLHRAVDGANKQGFAVACEQYAQDATVLDTDLPDQLEVLRRVHEQHVVDAPYDHQRSLDIVRECHAAGPAALAVRNGDIF